MAEVIQGSKSSLYIKEPIPGINNSSDTFTHQSIQNLWDGRGAADVLIHAVRQTSLVASTVEAGSVRRLIKSTAHGALAGDAIRFNNGVADGEEVAIIKIVDANYFIISKEVNASIGDEIFFLKPVTPTYNKDGSLNVSVVPSPIAYNRKSGGTTVATTVLEDLDTSANSRPLPVAILSQNILTGTYAENLALTTVYTFTAPAGAIGAIVQADDANANSLRAKQGAAATATSGMQLQAGRDMKFDSGTNISVCSESASVKVYVQWFVQN